MDFASLEPNLSRNSMNSLGIVGAMQLAGLNIVVLVFFVLWKTADSIAVGHMESKYGMDSGQTNPNSELMWLAAIGFELVAAVTAVLIVVWLVNSTRSLPRDAKGNITPTR